MKNVMIVLFAFCALGVAIWATKGVSKSQTAQNPGEMIAYQTSVVRVGESFTFKAIGLSGNDWSLRNAEGTRFDLQQGQKDGTVTVTLTVTKAPNQELVKEGATAAPMIVWENGSKRVNIPLTILSRGEATPSGACEMDLTFVGDQQVYKIPSYPDPENGWPEGQAPTVFIPMTRETPMQIEVS